MAALLGSLQVLVFQTNLAISVELEKKKKKAEYYACRAQNGKNVVRQAKVKHSFHFSLIQMETTPTTAVE